MAQSRLSHPPFNVCLTGTNIVMNRFPVVVFIAERALQQHRTALLASGAQDVVAMIKFGQKLEGFER